MRRGLYKLNQYKFCVVDFIRVGKKHDLHRNCLYRLRVKFTGNPYRTYRTLSMWTAAVGIHANWCLLEPVYRYSDSHSCLCERSL